MGLSLKKKVKNPVEQIKDTAQDAASKLKDVLSKTGHGGKGMGGFQIDESGDVPVITFPDGTQTEGRFEMKEDGRRVLIFTYNDKEVKLTFPKTREQLMKEYGQPIDAPPPEACDNLLDF